jgi:hypothetical protein
MAAFGAAFLNRWWAQRKEKREAKMWVFRTLMANRRSPHMNADSISALNLIDIVFHDDEKIVRLWRDYYGMLHGKELHPDHHHKFLDLLFAMADYLGYRNIKQTDMDKFYWPQFMADQANLNNACQLEFLRVLRNTNALLLMPRPQQQNPPPIPDPNTRLPTTQQTTPPQQPPSFRLSDIGEHPKRASGL